MEFVRLRERGIDVLAVVPPREPVVLDEMSVTPSKRWQKLEATKEAKRALAQVEKGKSFSDGYLKTLQQRLLTVERREALSGRESEGRQLATALGETRRSKVVTEALDVLARPKETRRFSDAYLTRLQQRLLGIERQDELLGRESEGRRLAEQLGEVRRSRLVAEAADVLARATEGRRFSEVYLKRLQQLLVAMERQNALSGQDSEGLQLAVALATLRR